MTSELVDLLRANQAAIRARWQVLLRDEFMTTALATPSLLARLFEPTLERLFAELEQPARDHPSTQSCPELTGGCGCGRNPYLALFRAGERALTETLALAAVRFHPDPGDAMGRLTDAIRSIASDDIDAFCSLCQFRPAAGCSGSQSRPALDPADSDRATGPSLRALPAYPCDARSSHP